MIALALLGVGSASAQEEACTAYDHTAWAAALDRAESAMFAGDVEPARAELIAAHRQVLCLDTIARPSLLARMSRDLALAFFFDQDDDATRRWALSYRAAGALPWDDEHFAEGHPFRDAVESAEDPITGGPEGAGLVYPKKGGVFMNGHLLVEPRAPAEVPLLVQVADKAGLITDTWWQDGAAFPERVIGPPGNPPEAPAWFVPEGAAVAVAEFAPPEGPPKAEAAPKAAKPPKAGKAEPEAKAAAVAKAEPAPKGKPAKPDASAAAKPEPAPARPQASAAQPAVAAAPAPAAAPAEVAAAPGAYVDPFADARRRALAREVSERESVDGAGNRTVVRTEVITFASDPSGGAPVSAKYYAEWLMDYGEWAPGGAMATRSADEQYLTGWSDRTPPDAAAPVTWVSFAAASAYCGSWGNRVAQVGQEVQDALIWEWRDGAGAPVWKGRDGTIRPADPRATSGDVGFRCAP